MKDSHKKKTALSLAISLTAPAITQFAQANYYAGGTLMVFSVALFLYYDHVDDKVKKQVELPEHLSVDDLHEFADIVQEQGPEVLEKLRSQK